MLFDYLNLGTFLDGLDWLIKVYVCNYEKYLQIKIYAMNQNTSNMVFYAQKS
jgi:hypothetical protein